jgi:hypothetical protein
VLSWGTSEKVSVQAVGVGDADAVGIEVWVRVGDADADAAGAVLDGVVIGVFVELGAVVLVLVAGAVGVVLGGGVMVGDGVPSSK